jgi:hypothetical protein
VLSSDEAFALLIRRLEAAGWHVERRVEKGAAGVEAAPALTPSERAR